MRKPLQPARSSDAPFLLVSLFVTGACSLVLEIAGARLISPLYGSSIYTWSAMITVTLAALSLGYWWGGRQADRHPHLTLFAKLMTAAGVTIAAVPWLKTPVLKASLPLGVQGGALASAAALMGPALVLLGALGPVAVRLTATGAADSGRRSGDAWAVSTLGSVIGAALTGFVLIPLMPLSKILYACAAMLALLGAIGSWISTHRLPAAQAAAFAAIAFLGLRPAPASKLARWSSESAYGRVAVLENDARRHLLVNGTSQSVMEKDTGESESQYIRAFEYARGLRPKAKTALVIGLGAGLLPKALERRGLVVDSIEIDPVIADAARAFFEFEPKGRVAVGDGRIALDAPGGPWDLVFLDAFGSEAPPAHLFTLEAFLQLRSKLTPGGVLAVNLVSALDGEDSRAWRSVHRTLLAAFPNARSFVGSDPSRGLANVLLFASAGPLEGGPPAGPERPAKEVALMLTRELIPNTAELSVAVVLEDDYAPLDSLIAGTARRWRRLLQDAMPEVLLD